MANTVVQFKRSTANDVPSVLSIGEPAYSFKSGKLFLGNTDGTIIAIGGKYFVDQSNTIFNTANLAYNTANAAYDLANISSPIPAFSQANTAYSVANGAYNTANSAYDTANTKFASSGGTVSGSVTITGDLIITGNTVTTNTSTLRISDPLIYLAGNNYTTDAVDIGFVGNYVNTTGQNVHTGFYREHTSKEYYLFYGYDQEPDDNHIDPTGNNFTIAVLNADIRTSNLNLGGVNAISWLNATYTTANNAYLTANGAYVTANDGYNQANTARTHANSAYAKANGAVQTGYPTIVANGNTLTAATNTSTLTIIAGTNIGITSNISNSSIVISDLVSGSAFDAANAAFNTANGSSNAANLTSGTIDPARLSGSYTGITGLGTIITGLWQGGTVNVAYGGTGMISFTTNGILYGNATGSIKVTAAGTDGQVLLANPSGVPIFSMLDGGTF